MSVNYGITDAERAAHAGPSRMTRRNRFECFLPSHLCRLCSLMAPRHTKLDAFIGDILCALTSAQVRGLIEGQTEVNAHDF